MSVSLSIIPFTDSLNMYGEPDHRAAYSLSGHVSVTLSSSSSLFGPRRATRLLLQSLLLTFEGQTELATQGIGYTAFRLCNISQELAPLEQLLLTDEGHEDDDIPCTWNIVFNLTIPGWLPVTSIVDDASTSYALHATATFEYADDNASGSWMSTLCSPLRFLSRSIQAPKADICLNRFISPVSSQSSSLFPRKTYSVTSQVSSLPDALHIPSDVLSKLRIIATVPGRISTEEESIPFCLCLNAMGLSADQSKRFRLSSYKVDVEQICRYRTSVSKAYMNANPALRQTIQPPHKPLLSPSPLQTIYEIGLGMSPRPNHVYTRTQSILPHLVCCTVDTDNGYIFSDNPSSASWYNLETPIPMTSDIDKSPHVQESGASPLFEVEHRLTVVLTYTYDMPEGGCATEHLHFHVPLRFVRVPPTHEPMQMSIPGGRIVSLQSANISPSSQPYAQSLPAYSQLFHANGERKIDWSAPLPQYTPCDELQQMS